MRLTPQRMREIRRPRRAGPDCASRLQAIRKILVFSVAVRENLWPLCPAFIGLGTALRALPAAWQAARSRMGHLLVLCASENPVAVTGEDHLRFVRSQRHDTMPSISPGA